MSFPSGEYCGETRRSGLYESDVTRKSPMNGFAAGSPREVVVIKPISVSLYAIVPSGAKVGVVAFSLARTS